MTRLDLESAVLEWDSVALRRRDPDTRKILWHILDALRGQPLTSQAERWLCEVAQTNTVVEIRERLGISEAPCWRKRGGL